MLGPMSATLCAAGPVVRPVPATDETLRAFRTAWYARIGKPEAEMLAQMEWNGAYVEDRLVAVLAYIDMPNAEERWLYELYRAPGRDGTSGAYALLDAACSERKLFAALPPAGENRLIEIYGERHGWRPICQVWEAP